MAAVHALLPHPARPTRAVTQVSVVLSDAPGDTLLLRFRASGPLAVECLASAAIGGRVDGLWAHTCCELFVQPARGTAYREFNFSPRGAWAAYDFDDYRAGMRPAVLQREPRLELATESGEWTLSVQLARADLGLPGTAARWRLGLCAVTESPDGALAYWALRHPVEKPDFHHRDAFVCEWG